MLVHFHRTAPRTAPRIGRAARAAAVVAVLLALAVTVAPAPVDEVGGLRVDAVDFLVERGHAHLISATASGRPPYRPEPPMAAGLATPPGRIGAHPAGVPKTVQGSSAGFRLQLADGALPLRYTVDPELAERFGLRQVVAAMSQWDGIPGSRWSTRFAGVRARGIDEPVADGVATVYLRGRCPPGQLGSVRWHLDPHVAWHDWRHGAGAVFTTDVDIAVCPRVRDVDQMTRLLAHELGHVVGQDHLCERAAACQRHADAPPPNCRIMYWRLHRCGELDELDRDMARHLYPTLPRLAGTGAAETAARAVYATTRTRSAGQVLIAHPGVHVRDLAPALVTAGLADAPLLLAGAEFGGCLLGPGGVELARAAAPGATVVLLGDWPPSCERVLDGWGLSVRRVEVDGRTGARRIADMLAAADRTVAEVQRRRGRAVSEAVLAPLPQGVHAADPDQAAVAYAAAAFAARRGAPLLLVPGGRTPSAVAAWLQRRPEIHHVWAVGSPSVLRPALTEDLRGRGLRVTRVGGALPATTAQRLAERTPPTAPLAVAALGRPTDVAVAASVAARTGAAVLTVADGQDAPAASLAALLHGRNAAGGYVVGLPDALPYPLQWALATAVSPARDARLDPAWRLEQAGPHQPPLLEPLLVAARQAGAR